MWVCYLENFKADGASQGEKQHHSIQPIGEAATGNCTPWVQGWPLKRKAPDSYTEFEYVAKQPGIDKLSLGDRAALIRPSISGTATPASPAGRMRDFLQQRAARSAAATPAGRMRDFLQVRAARSAAATSAGRMRDFPQVRAARSAAATSAGRMRGFLQQRAARAAPSTPAVTVSHATRFQQFLAQRAGVRPPGMISRQPFQQPGGALRFLLRRSG